MAKLFRSADWLRLSIVAFPMAAQIPRDNQVKARNCKSNPWATISSSTSQLQQSHLESCPPTAVKWLQAKRDWICCPSFFWQNGNKGIKTEEFPRINASCFENKHPGFPSVFTAFTIYAAAGDHYCDNVLLYWHYLLIISSLKPN